MRFKIIRTRPLAAISAIAIGAGMLSGLSLLTSTPQSIAASLFTPTGPNAGSVSVTDGGPDCNGVIPPAPNNLKTLTGGNLSSPGSASYDISYPADLANAGTFTVGDCVLQGPAGATDLSKFTVIAEATFGFVDNGTNFNLDFNLNIPSLLPVGTQICNVAKTTSSPSASPAANRKSGPACFTIGGAAEFHKKSSTVLNGSGPDIPGGTFTVDTCTNTSIIGDSQPIIVSVASGTLSPADGKITSTNSSVTATGPGEISLNGASGSSCTVTETAAPAGYQISPSPAQVLTIPSSPGPSNVVNLFDDPNAGQFTTALTTTQSAGFQLGTAPGTMSDVAHLTVGPGNGEIAFHVYSDDSCGTAGGAEVTPAGWAPAAADSTGDYNSPASDFAPAAAGTYYFTAAYTSDDGANSDITTPCADEPVTVTPSSNLCPGCSFGGPSGGSGAASFLGVTRIGGTDRIDTADLISQATYAAGKAGAVVLARADLFPDSLAGTPLAVLHSAPILLTMPTNLDPRTATEIQRVLPAGGTVYLLGQTDALSTAVANAVQSLGYTVVRIGGVDRFATATDIGSVLGTLNRIFLANGANFPDALTAAAASGKGGTAIILTNGTNMPTVSADFIAANAGAKLYDIGGPAAGAAPTGATELVGADRYATGVLVAQTFFSAPTGAGVATGLNFPDALTAGPYLVTQGWPMLLTDPNSLSTVVSDYLTSVKASIVAINVFGGVAAVTDTVFNQLVALFPAPSSSTSG